MQFKKITPNEDKNSYLFLLSDSINYEVYLL